jgi:anti-sigma factor (TIGR02949 family)
MFNCKDSIALLQDFLDGEMGPEERAHLQEHLRGCPPCVDFLKTYAATPKLCRFALDKKMPEEMAGRLVSFLRAKCKK